MRMTNPWRWTAAVTVAAVTAAPAWAGGVRLYPLADVRLGDGPFKDAEEADRAYMLAHNVDRLLAPFRREAGLAQKAPPYGNWESMGLDGHTAGHYLAALALMVASTGDAEMKRRMDYIVAELADCQRANGDGYVGGVPNGRALWADVAAGRMKVTGFGINDRWVPWYNLHKLYAGLRDAYLIGHNEQARAVLVGLADWCDKLLGHLSDAQVQEMLSAEQGGMDEVLADVSAITGDPKYLRLARRFCDRSLLGPLSSGQDQLTGKHANTQIPKVIGFQRIAALDGPDADALHRAASFFWDDVTEKRSVAIGGNSVNEHFNSATDFTSMVQDRTGPETCNTYNMLRLTEQLYAADAAPRYADFYERALFNHILSSEDVAHGGFVYFTPMRPRQYRVYSQAGKGFWCCVGTGFENHAKYGEFVYGHDDHAVYVNLFIASTLTDPDRGLTLRQETTFPDEPRTKLRMSLAKPASFALMLRHPAWVAAGEMRVRVNGQDQPVAGGPSTYAAVTREWHDGDTVDVDLPMRLAAERLPDGSDYVALRYGPIVLAAATGTEDMPGQFAGDGRGDHIATGPLEPLAGAPTLVADDVNQAVSHVVPVAGEPLTFTASDLIRPSRYADLRLVPFFRVHETRYEIYWPISTPGAYAAQQAKLAVAERARLALDRATVDRVTPGEQQTEVEHDFHGEQTSQGSFRRRAWRDARGWFSYTMKGSPVPADLMVTCYGGDRDRAFDVLVDGKVLATVILDGSRGDRFVDLKYPLPAGADKPITVKFAAHSGSIAGGVFDLRVVRRGGL